MKPVKYILSAAAFSFLAASLFAATAPAQADDSILSEVRIGAMDHEASLFRDDVKEDGLDINGEVLFDSPDWLDWAGAPRPHIGVTAATKSDSASFAYTGLSWDWNFWGPLFVEGALGAALHNGETGLSSTENEMGCAWAFHESGSLGYMMGQGHRLMLTVEHFSNAGLCDLNEGVTNVGMRYGYRF